MKTRPVSSEYVADDSRQDVGLIKQPLHPRAVFDSLRTLGITVSVSISLLVALFLIVEIVSFATFRVRQGQAVAIGEVPYLYPGQPWAKQFWKESQMATKYQYKPYIIWRHAPFSGEFVNVDANGLRRTVNSNCSAGEYNIWMFGNSTMWGTSVPDAETIPSMMAEHYGRTRGSVCIINFGESAWVSTQEVVQLMLALKSSARPPDLVIFCDGPSDVLVQYETGQADVHDNFDQIQQIFEKVGERRGGFAYLRQTNTYLLLDRVLNELNHRLPMPSDSTLPTRDCSSNAQAAAKNYLENMTLVQALADSYGFRYLSFLGPAIFLGNKPLSSEETSLRKGLEKEVPGMAQLFRKTYDGILDARNNNIVDIENSFDETPEALYVGLAHVSPQGDRLVADRMFAVLRDRGF